MRPIDADTLDTMLEQIDMINKACGRINEKYSISKFRSMLKKRPTIGITNEQGTGHWIKVDNNKPAAYDCSKCGAMVHYKYEYCPKCYSIMNEK